jgi:FtsZ-binding cell division protein ZapB
MNRNSFLIFAIGILLLCSIAGAQGANSPKSMELQRKIHEIKSLRLSVESQVDTAVKTHEQLQTQIDELANEINRELVSRGINSYSKAAKVPRINYNVKLIQQLLAYIDRLDQREQYYRAGYETLEHLNQQVDDDLKLIRTLNDMEVDELIDRINSVLDEYIPETQTPLFSIDNIQSRPPEEIWHRIVNNN